MSLFPMTRQTGYPMDEVLPDFEADQAGAKRKRLLAETFRKRGMEQPQGRMVGRFFVAPSLAEGLVPLANTVSAGMLDNQAEKQERETAQADQRVFKQWASKFGPQKEKVQLSPEMGAIDGSVIPEENIEMEVPQTRDQVLKLALEGMRIPSARGLAGQVAGKALSEDLERRKPLVVGDSVYQDGQFHQAPVSETKLKELRIKEAEMMHRAADRALDRDSRERVARELNEVRLQIARITGQGNGLLNQLRQGQIDDAERRRQQAALGKPLPPHTIEKLSTYSDAPGKTSDFLNRYKDDYSGLGPISDITVWAGEKVPGMPQSARDAAEWWKSYQEHKNVVRSRLFGSALTDNERREWEKQDITPQTNPEIVRKVLARRAELEQQAWRKIRDRFKNSGYDMSGFDTVDDILGELEPPPAVGRGQLPTPNSRTAPPAGGAAAPAPNVTTGAALEEDTPEVLAQTWLQAGDPTTRTDTATKLRAKGIATPSSLDEFKALKSGTQYVDKDGIIKVKK